MTNDERRALVNDLKNAIGRTPESDTGWALRLKARDEAGERLTITQRQMYREALKFGDGAIVSGGAFPLPQVPVETAQERQARIRRYAQQHGIELP